MTKSEAADDPPVVRLVVLDSNVIGSIAASSSEQQDAAVAQLDRIKREGAQIFVTGTIVHEIAATFARQDTFDKLLATITRVCDGCLDVEAPEVMRVELEEDDPYAIITGRKPLPVSALEALKDAVKQDEVKKFYALGGFGNDGLRHLLEALDPVRKSVRNQIESFGEYVEARRIPCLTGLLQVSQERGHIPRRDWDAEALWKKGTAWRFSTLVYLANEYRRLTQTQGKGEGSLTDLRVVIEAAYSHEILTGDKEFVGCGELANKIVSKPVVSLWETASDRWAPTVRKLPPGRLPTSRGGRSSTGSARATYPGLADSRRTSSWHVSTTSRASHPKIIALRPRRETSGSTAW